MAIRAPDGANNIPLSVSLFAPYFGNYNSQFSKTFKIFQDFQNFQKKLNFSQKFPNPHRSRYSDQRGLRLFTSSKIFTFFPENFQNSGHINIYIGKIMFSIMAPIISSECDKILKNNCYRLAKYFFNYGRLWAKIENLISPDHVFY